LIKNNVKNESGYIDKEGLIALVIIGIICFALYCAYIFPIWRGPAADVEINAVVDPQGTLSEYRVTLQFVDDLSYSQFLAYTKSQNFPSMVDYEFRTIYDSQYFSIKNDSSARTITIKTIHPFDPNNVTTNIRIKKNQDSWEYEDKSIINSSHLPEQYVNKLTYTLSIPTDEIFSNTLENSTSWWKDGKELIWHIDRNKNPLNPKGDNIATSTIYAKFKVPDPNAIPRIYLIIGGLVILVVIFLLIRKR
jgi:hypothetical protein